jgi:uncharacterized repeat protein (TIGR01451 family)
VPAGSLAHRFISEPQSVNIFTGGGSKDPIDLGSWKWKSGSVPDKDTITNGYAAAYQRTDGHLLLEFGADRFAQNGDANLGLWFFQSDVHTVGATAGGFSGTHTTNDIFVVSAFTQGGGGQTISVYEWQPLCTKAAHTVVPVTDGGSPGGTDDSCAAANLSQLFASTSPPPASCSGVDLACATVNSAATTVGWPYLAKVSGSTSKVIPAGGFYEGGIDVTGLLNLAGVTDIPCFTSFLIETRSSQSPSAVLKDFVSGKFPLCALSLTKTCAGDGVVGSDITYTFNGTITNSGIGSLHNVTVVDTLPAGATNVSYTPPAGGSSTPPVFPSIAAGATENWSVTFHSTSLSVQNSALAKGAQTDVTPGSCGPPPDAGTVCSSSDQDTCTTTPSNSVTITKNCGVPTGYPNAVLPGTQLVTAAGLAAVQVNFSGNVCNTGDTQLSNVTLTDSPSATITLASSTIGPCTVFDASHNCTAPTCVKYSGSYLPSGVTPGDLGGAAGRYAFADTIKVTGATAALGDPPPHPAACTGAFLADAQACGGTTCNICPGTATCSGN